MPATINVCSTTVAASCAGQESGPARLRTTENEAKQTGGAGREGNKLQNIRATTTSYHKPYNNR